MFQVSRILPLIVSAFLLSACGAGNFLEWPKSATVPESDWAESSGLERLSVAHPDIGGLTISYVRAGDASGQRVIFVHGSPGSAGNYSRYLANVPEGFEYITVDRPGFGFTTPVKSLSDLSAQAASIKPLLIGGNGEPSILVGWSYGGPVIVQAAADYPTEVKGLVIQAGALDPDLEKVRFVQRVGNVWPFSRFVEDGWRIANEELIPLEKELKKLAPKLPTITTPTVIMHGEDDELVPVGNADYMVANMTGVSDMYVERYPGYRHSIPFTKYTQSVAAIVRLNAGFATPVESRLTVEALVDGIRAGDINPFTPKLADYWFAGDQAPLKELRDWARERDSHIKGKVGIKAVRDLEMCAAEPVAYSVSRYFDYLDSANSRTEFEEDLNQALDAHDFLEDGIARSIRRQGNNTELTPLGKDYLTRAIAAITGSEIAEIYEGAELGEGAKSDTKKALIADLSVAEYCGQKLDNKRWLVEVLDRDGWPTKEKVGGDISVFVIRLLLETDDAAFIKVQRAEIVRLIEEGEIDKAALKRLDDKLAELEGA